MPGRLGAANGVESSRSKPAFGHRLFPVEFAERRLRKRIGQIDDSADRCVNKSFCSLGNVKRQLRVRDSVADKLFLARKMRCVNVSSSIMMGMTLWLSLFSTQWLMWRLSRLTGQEVHGCRTVQVGAS